jgi:CheY-like chemotaxis protein
MMKVLVVDDEKDIEFLYNLQFRKELRAGKMQLHYAFSGDEALAFMKTLDPFDLALLMSDVNMPGMTGFELLAETRKLFPQLNVILITAYNDARNRIMAEEGGAQAFLSKPLNFDELRNLLFNEKENS